MANPSQLKVISYNCDNDLPEEIINYSFTQERSHEEIEILEFASFLEEFNPNQILVVTYSSIKDTTYIKVLTIAQKKFLFNHSPSDD